MSKVSSIFTVGLDHIKLCLVMGRHPLNNASFLPYKLQKIPTINTTILMKEITFKINGKLLNFKLPCNFSF